MKIQVKNVDTSGSIDVDIHLDDVIQAVNKLNIQQRWSYIGKLLEGIDNNDYNELTDDQKGIIERYLWRKSDEIKQSRK